MTDMDLDAIDELLTELSEYSARLMLSEGLPVEVVQGLRSINGDQGTMVHVADAVDSVLDLRLIVSARNAI